MHHVEQVFAWVLLLTAIACVIRAQKKGGSIMTREANVLFLHVRELNQVAGKLHAIYCDHNSIDPEVWFTNEEWYRTYFYVNAIALLEGKPKPDKIGNELLQLWAANILAEVKV